ncbi:hypothetical protein LX36DRAFT_229256 [Colletotrichum falcatum]|nr:hypothetical protein LX36DRAFT_229256 [Colletotrichum falcatum]
MLPTPTTYSLCTWLNPLQCISGKVLHRKSTRVIYIKLEKSHTCGERERERERERDCATTLYMSIMHRRDNVLRGALCRRSQGFRQSRVALTHFTCLLCLHRALGRIAETRVPRCLKLGRLCRLDWPFAKLLLLIYPALHDSTVAVSSFCVAHGLNP